MSGPGGLQRIRQTGRLLRSEGASGVAARLARRAYRQLAPEGEGRLPVAREDLMRAAQVASSGRPTPRPLPALPGEPLTVAWVCGPPGAGSGGHTTMLRLVSALEQAGHTCILYLDDQHGWSLDEHRRTIRTWWPWVNAEVRDVSDGIADAHAVFATAWETAYKVLASPAKGVRFYLVQDFEPAFYPAGSESLLAEATYSFGFHGVTAGPWLSERLRRDYGMAADHFDFGRDPVYRLQDDGAAAGARTGVCFYARPETPRRSFGLGVLALELFAAQHPEVEIHLFGRTVKKLPFEATQHGLLTPEALNDLYNRCIAGFVLSATNVSLVPHEMLAAGCIPVVNDAHHNRVVLDNPAVVYAPATPFDLAGALGSLADRPSLERTAAAHAAARSVRGSLWDDAGNAVEHIVRDVVESASVSALRQSEVAAAAE